MPSREVTSNQAGIHQHLQAVVEKHLATPWQKPMADFSREVFARVKEWLALDDRPLILDSCCGTGESSVRLAKKYPRNRVLGFDRSETRLNKLDRKLVVPENCFTIRANADDLWRQLVAANIHPVRHFVLFPNPYPKAAQLNQRWHGSPVFPYLIALGGSIEVRSNWKTYLDELAAAITIATSVEPRVEEYQPELVLSAFEKKYRDSGHTLWRLRAQLPDVKDNSAKVPDNQHS